MLSAKPWRLEALIRLGLGVVICFFMGTLAVALLRLTQTHGAGRVGLSLAVILGGWGACGGALVLRHRPWDIERTRTRLMLFLLCLYAGLTLAAVAQRLTRAADAEPGLWQMVIAGLSFQGAALALL